MSYIMRDENGGERVIAPWGGVDPLGERAELIRTTGGGGRKGFLGLGGRYPTWEHTFDTDTGISTIDTEGYGTRRYRTVTDPDGYMREEMLPPSYSSPMLSEEETNQRKWGLLNSVVDAIKAGGSKLGDFLYGDTDFGYMEETQEQRRNAADEARRRESAERAIRERDQSREWRQIDMMDSGPKGPRRAGYGLDMFGNPISRY